MVDKNILNYLNEGKKRGFGFDLLKQKLLTRGYKQKDIDEAVSVSAFKNYFDQKIRRPIKPQLIDGSHSIPSSEKLSFFSKVSKSLIHPIEIFNKTRGEGIWPSLKYYLALSTIPFFIVTFIMVFFTAFVASLFTHVPQESGSLDLILPSPIFIVLYSFLYFFIFGSIFLFIGSGIVNLFIKLFKGKGTYLDTFRVAVYSATPILLIGFIMPIFPLVCIWSLVLMIFGLALAHNISKLRSFLSLAVLNIFLFVVWFIIFLIARS